MEYTQVQCLLCTKQIDAYPRWHCSLCEKYACSVECQAALEKEHFFLREDNPIVGDPIFNCVDCGVEVTGSEKAFFCYECYEYICPDCEPTHRQPIG